MSLDTRARRAADGVRASVTGVNPMTTLEDLKQTDQTRRRGGAVAAVVALALVVAGGTWYAVGMRNPAHNGGANPVSSMSPSPTDVRPIVGTHLVPGIVARVPALWTVVNDSETLWLNHGSGASFEVSGPIVKAIDPVSQKVVGAPSDYHAWLVTHPWVQVVSDDIVTVDGIVTHVTRYILQPPASAKVSMLDLVSDTPGFHAMKAGETVIDVAIPLRRDSGASGYRILRAHNVMGPGRGLAAESGLSDFLASLQLP